MRIAPNQLCAQAPGLVVPSVWDEKSKKFFPARAYMLFSQQLAGKLNCPSAHHHPLQIVHIANCTHVKAFAWRANLRFATGVGRAHAKIIFCFAKDATAKEMVKQHWGSLARVNVYKSK